MVTSLTLICSEKKKHSNNGPIVSSLPLKSLQCVRCDVAVSAGEAPVRADDHRPEGAEATSPCRALM